MLKRLQERFDNEPVMVIEALRAIIMCAVGFGLTMTNEQQALLMVTVGAVIALLTRGKVTPSSGADRVVDITKVAPAILLAFVLAGGAAACAPRNIAPELVTVEDGIHDAMQSAFEGVERICAPGLLPETCKAINGAMASALRAGRAFSVAVHSERLEGLGAFVADVGRAIGDIQKLPAGELRDRVVADLRRAIDQAFKGARK